MVEQLCITPRFIPAVVTREPVIASQTKVIRLLIADEQFVVREGLTTVLNRQADMAVVADASTADDTVRLFRLHQPDVVLLEINQGGFDGLQALQWICDERPNARVIVFTSCDGEE